MCRRALSCIIVVAVSIKLLTGLASGEVPEAKVGNPFGFSDVSIDDLAIKIDKRPSRIGKNKGIDVIHRDFRRISFGREQRSLNYVSLDTRGQNWFVVRVIKVYGETLGEWYNMPIYPCVNLVGWRCAKIFDVENDKISEGTTYRQSSGSVIRDVNARTVEHNGLNANVCSLLSLSSSFRADYQVAGGIPKKCGNQDQTNCGDANDKAFMVVKEVREIPEQNIEHVMRGALIYAAMLIALAYVAFRR